MEAVQRKAYIDLLQSQKRTDELRQAAMEYKRSRAIEKAVTKIARDRQDDGELVMADTPEENMTRTYREFMERFLPAYARKRNFSPRPTTATLQT